MPAHAGKPLANLEPLRLSGGTPDQKARGTTGSRKFGACSGESRAATGLSSLRAYTQAQGG